jgi:hypothetical protein
VFHGKTPKFLFIHRKADFFISLTTRDMPWGFVERVSFACTVSVCKSDMILPYILSKYLQAAQLVLRNCATVRSAS